VEKKKLFLIECSAEQWLTVAKELSPSVEIVLWTAWFRLENDIKTRFPETLFCDTIKCKKGLDELGIFSLNAQFDEVCESIWREEAQIVYDQMNRFDFSRDMNLVSRSNLFLTTLLNWKRKLLEFQPDLVVFSTPPHVVYDYIILCLCRRLGIQTLMFEEFTISNNRSTYFNDYITRSIKEENPPDSLISKSVSQYIDKLQSCYQEAIPLREKLAQDQKNQFLARKFRNRFAKVLKILLQNLISGSNGTVNRDSLYKQSGMELSTSFRGRFASFNFALRQIIEERYQRKLEFTYTRLIQDIDDNQNLGNYLYVALAGQPERTSNPQADIFTNQLLLLSVLSSALPPGWKILVKEHPNTFNPSFSSTMNRSLEFYEIASQIPGVFFVDTSTDVFTLVDNSAAVATVGGTVGIEAVCRKKPVLLFGNAWYQSCPGINRVSNLSEVREVLDNLTAFQTFSPKDVHAYLSATLANGFEGIADVPNWDFVVTEPTNSMNIAKVILSHL
jgi:hypothetical protein